MYRMMDCHCEECPTINGGTDEAISGVTKRDCFAPLAMTLIVACLVATGCAPRSAYIRTVGDKGLVEKRLDQFLKEHPFGLNDVFQLEEVYRTKEQSVHLVRIRTREAPHSHALHDVTVFMQKGGGTLYLKGQPVELRPGDIVTIPNGVRHYYVNRSTESVSQAVVVFSPPFDGKDTVQ